MEIPVYNNVKPKYESINFNDFIIVKIGVIFVTEGIIILNRNTPNNKSLPGNFNLEKP
jgi:hypothetical protein